MTTFITVKGESKRCPNKNKILLPYVLEQVVDYMNVIVITDSIELKQIAETYNVKVFLEDKKIQTSEFNSIYNYLVETGDSMSDFIYLPVTQPFRNNSIIKNIQNLELENYDLITTYSVVPNRSIFLLNEDNTYKIDSYERKGCLCPEVKMIDGCIYKIKTEFLYKVINSDSPNHTFWNKSKIKFIENKLDVFLDVDTLEDLRRFEILKNYY